MITAAYFDKHLAKREKLTVYSGDNLSHTVTKEYHLTTEPDRATDFDMDCMDLARFCDQTGLTLKPNK